MLLGLVLIVILIALNAFFVAAEFAIIKVRYSAVEADVAAGSKVAKVSQAILDKLDKYLSAAQIGITLASLALGWVGEPVVAALLVESANGIGLPLSETLAHQIAVPVGFVAITVLHLVFGEAIPKYAAIYYPQEFTYACAIPLKLFAVVTAPLVWMINGLTWLILAPLGISVQSEEDTHTEEELRLLLAESAQSGEVGAIQKTEHELIEKVFKFDERVVRQVMVPRPQMAAIDIATPIDEALTLISREGYSRVPVYSGTKDNVVGILHEKELLRRVLDKQPIDVSRIMRPALFVPETKKIGSLLRELQNKRSHIHSLRPYQHYYLGLRLQLNRHYNDNTSIGHTAGSLHINTDGVNTTHIDWGSGTNQVSASDVPLDTHTWVNITTPADVQDALEKLDAGLSGAGKKSWSWGASSISSNNTNRYLDKFDGVVTNQSPYVAWFASKLRAISLSTNVAGTWTAEVHVNGVSVSTLASGGNQYAQISGLDISIAAGDRVSFYLSGTAIDRPSIDALFEEA